MLGTAKPDRPNDAHKKECDSNTKTLVATLQAIPPRVQAKLMLDGLAVLFIWDTASQLNWSLNEGRQYARFVMPLVLALVSILCIHCLPESRLINSSNSIRGICRNHCCGRDPVPRTESAVDDDTGVDDEAGQAEDSRDDDVPDIQADVEDGKSPSKSQSVAAATTTTTTASVALVIPAVAPKVVRVDEPESTSTSRSRSTALFDNSSDDD